MQQGPGQQWQGGSKRIEQVGQMARERPASYNRARRREEGGS